MNFIKVFSVAILFLGVSQMNAQKKETGKTNNETSQQKPVDNPTKCNNIKEGTFLRNNYPKNLWYMTTKDNVQTEYYNEGKDYVKASMVFIDDCNYKLIVLDVKGDNQLIKVDDVFTNKIISTKDNYLQIQSQIKDDKYNIVLVKVKESKK